jgi:hypothetical protein
VISWRCKFKTSGIRNQARSSAAIQRGMPKPAATRGRNAAQNLDQKTAMRREQRHICSGRRLRGRREPIASNCRPDKHCIKFFRLTARGLSLAGIQTCRRSGSLRARDCGGRCGRRTAAGQPAFTGNMATSAALRLGHAISWLHPRRYGEEGGQKKPC